VSWRAQAQVLSFTPSSALWTAGANVTLNGTNLDAMAVTSVAIGAVRCTVVGAVTSAAATCTLTVPSNVTDAATLSGNVRSLGRMRCTPLDRGALTWAHGRGWHRWWSR
jgi:hypothetical protein